jgi:transmembrane sensor
MKASTGMESLQVPGSTAEQAGAWDARLRAPDCTDEDRARFAAWRDADPANHAAFERLQSIIASLRHDRGRANVRALRDEALRAAERHQRHKLWSVGLVAAACAVTVGASLWHTPAATWLRTPMTELVSYVKGDRTFATGNGQRSTFVLADGSFVELNAESRIKVAFTKAGRDIELINGQALFSVAKDPQRPFIVHAGNREIVAVGTQFDVRLDARTLQVTLIEGKVRVDQSADAGRAREAFKPREIILTPGRQLIAKLATTAAPMPYLAEGVRTGAEGSNLVRDIDVAKVTGWRDGRIFLEDLSLEDAVDEMNKHSAMQIRVDNEALLRIRVNGMFRAGEQEAFVAALEQYFPIAGKRRGENEIVLTSRR